MNYEPLQAFALKHRVPYNELCVAAREAATPAPMADVHAGLWRLAVLKGLVTIHSELIDPRNHGTRVSWMRGHDKACDISNAAADSGVS